MTAKMHTAVLEYDSPAHFTPFQGGGDVVRKWHIMCAKPRLKARSAVLEPL